MRLSRDLTLACELTGDVEAIKKANVELKVFKISFPKGHLQ